MNVLHKDALVLEHITLGPQIEAVVPAGHQRRKKILKNVRIHKLFAIQRHQIFHSVPVSNVTELNVRLANAFNGMVILKC